MGRATLPYSQTFKVRAKFSNLDLDMNLKNYVCRVQTWSKRNGCFKCRTTLALLRDQRNKCTFMFLYVLQCGQCTVAFHDKGRKLFALLTKRNKTLVYAGHVRECACSPSANGKCPPIEYSDKKDPCFA